MMIYSYSVISAVYSAVREKRYLTERQQNSLFFTYLISQWTNMSWTCSATSRVNSSRARTSSNLSKRSCFAPSTAAGPQCINTPVSDVQAAIFRRAWISFPFGATTESNCRHSNAAVASASFTKAGWCCDEAFPSTFTQQHSQRQKKNTACNDLGKLFTHVCLCHQATDQQRKKELRVCNMCR